MLLLCIFGLIASKLSASLLSQYASIGSLPETSLCFLKRSLLIQVHSEWRILCRNFFCSGRHVASGIDPIPIKSLAGDCTLLVSTLFYLQFQIPYSAFGILPRPVQTHQDGPIFLLPMYLGTLLLSRPSYRVSTYKAATDCTC